MRTRACTLGVFVVFVVTGVAHADDSSRQQIGGDGATLPAISGTTIVWSQPNYKNADGTNGPLDVKWAELDGPATATNTRDDGESFADVDQGIIVWVHAGSSNGDIAWKDLSSFGWMNIANATATVGFAYPAINAGRAVYERITTNTLYTLECYKCTTSTMTISIPTSSSDGKAQRRPRINGDVIVFEQYTDANPNPPAKPSVVAYSISTRTSRMIAAASAGQPDVDNNRIVWVGGEGDNQQIYACDLGSDGTCGATMQVTNTASRKESPRISGSRVVWADARNDDALHTIKLDLFIYDFNNPGAGETLLEGGLGDQSKPNLDGDRLVYVSSAGTDSTVQLYTLPAAAPPPTPPVPLGCDDNQTTIVGAAQTLTSAATATSTIKKTASVPFPSEVAAGTTFYICIENGMADGSQRATRLAAAVDGIFVIPWTNFSPTDAPRWIAGTVTVKLAKSWLGALMSLASGPVSATFTLRAKAP